MSLPASNDAALSSSASVVAPVPPPPPAAAPTASALAQRAGATLAQLLALTNGINARRGTAITHVMPAGIVDAAGASADAVSENRRRATLSSQPPARRSSATAGRQGRMQHAAEAATSRDTSMPQSPVIAVGALAAATPTIPDFPAAQPVVPSLPPPPPPRANPHRRSRSAAMELPLDRFATGGSYARRAARQSAVLAQASDAFAPELVRGAAAAEAAGDHHTLIEDDADLTRRALLRDAARVRAFTPNYARRGGGMLVSAAYAIKGVDPHTGRNFLVQQQLLQQRGDKDAAATPMGAPPLPAPAGARERGVAYAASYGTQAELARLQAALSPGRASRSGNVSPTGPGASAVVRNEFREQLFRQSALLEEPGAVPAAQRDGAAGAVNSKQTIAGAVLALPPPLPAAQGNDYADIASRVQQPPQLQRQHSPQSNVRSSDVPEAQSLVLHHSWRAVLSKAPSERSEAEVHFLAMWLSQRLRHHRSTHSIASLPLEVLQSLARTTLTLRTVEAGEVLAHEGDPVDRMLLLLEGSVALGLTEAQRAEVEQVRREREVEEAWERRQLEARQAEEVASVERVNRIKLATQNLLLMRRASAAFGGASPTLQQRINSRRSSTLAQQPSSAASSSSSSSQQRSPLPVSPRRSSAPRGLITPPGFEIPSAVPASAAKDPSTAAASDADADSSSPAAAPGASSSPSPDSLSPSGRKLIRATRLLTSFTRARRRGHGPGASTGGEVLTCAQCGQNGHLEAACPVASSLSPDAASNSGSRSSISQRRLSLSPPPPQRALLSKSPSRASNDALLVLSPAASAAASRRTSQQSNFLSVPGSPSATATTFAAVSADAHALLSSLSASSSTSVLASAVQQPLERSISLTGVAPSAASSAENEHSVVVPLLIQQHHYQETQEQLEPISRVITIFAGEEPQLLGEERWNQHVAAAAGMAALGLSDDSTTDSALMSRNQQLHRACSIRVPSERELASSSSIGSVPTGPCLVVEISLSSFELAAAEALQSLRAWHVRFLREVFLFRRWGADKLAAFAAGFERLALSQYVAHARHVNVGHTFYRTGDPADCVYFVVAGRVALRLQEDTATAAAAGSSAGTELTLFGADGAWIGGDYLRDDAAEARAAALAAARVADEAAQLRALTSRHGKWAHLGEASRRRRKLRNVKPRYMEPRDTAEARLLERERRQGRSQREKHEARVLAALEVGADDAARLAAAAREKSDPLVFAGSFIRDDVLDAAEGASDSWSSSSSSSAVSTTSSSSDADDEMALARRAERQRLKAQERKVRRRARRRARREGVVQDSLSQYEGLQHTELHTGGCAAHTGVVPADGATSYLFFKVKLDRADFFAPATTLNAGPDDPAAGHNSNQSGHEKMLRVTLKPVLNHGGAAVTAQAKQFDLFAGSQSCRYPSKFKYTWPSCTATAAAPKKSNGSATGGDSGHFTRSILIRPGSEASFQAAAANGHDPLDDAGQFWLYVSVFHPINEAAILAFQDAHHGAMPAPQRDADNNSGFSSGSASSSSPAFELVVEVVSARANRWGAGSRAHVPRVHDLASLGPCDLFGAEEVVQAHESTAALARGDESAGRRGAALTALGRLNSAVVVSPGGARVLAMPREHFMLHVRGGMLASLKALLRRQLAHRAQVLEQARQIEQVTEARVGTNQGAKDFLTNCSKSKATIMRTRPHTAHAASRLYRPQVADEGADGDGPARPHSLLSTEQAAAFHHRADMSDMTVPTQRERAELERLYARQLEQERLQAQVREQFLARDPDAVGSPSVATQQQLGQSLQQHPSTARALWTLTPSEALQAKRRALLLASQRRSHDGIEVHFKQSAEDQEVLPQPTRLQRLLSPKSQTQLRRAHPGTAPSHRIQAPAAESPLLLMPGSDQHTFDASSSTALVPSSSHLAALGSLDDALLPCGTNGALSSSSTVDPSPQPHALDSQGVSARVLRRSEKAMRRAQDRVAMQLFGRKLHRVEDAAQQQAKLAKSSRAASGKGALKDGPVFGAAGSSASAGTLSRQGARMAVDAGLRNHWQRELTVRMVERQRREDALAVSARENPFADPTLTNPYLYIPSLYDSAATDPQLNALAIQLGIPQPQPLAQPHDSANVHRRAVTGPDGQTMLDIEVDAEARAAAASAVAVSANEPSRTATVSPAKQLTVEERLRAARHQHRRTTSQAKTSEEKEEEMVEPFVAASSPSPAPCSPPPPPAAASLWQSELLMMKGNGSVAGSRSSPTVGLRAVPFVTQTELAHLVHLVRFEPKQQDAASSQHLPARFRNKQREAKETARKAAEVREAQQALLLLMPPPATAAAATESSETTPAAAPSPPVAPQRLVRPASATMYGSFALKAPAPATSSPSTASTNASPAKPPVAAACSGDADDLSTIFSLTQVFAQQQLDSDDAADEAEHTKQEQSQALVLHERQVSPVRSPRKAAASSAAAPQGNLFMAAAPVDPSLGIPQREESEQERLEKEAVQVLLRAQREGLSIAARMAEASRTLSARPRSAQTVLRETRRAHSARRPHKPPSIPSRTQPPKEAAARAQMELEQRQDDQVRTVRAGLFPRPFRSIGRRKDMQFFTPVQMLTRAKAVNAAGAASAGAAAEWARPPLHPSARPVSAAFRAAVAHSAAQNLSAAHSAAGEALSAASVAAPDGRFFADYMASIGAGRAASYPSDDDNDEVPPSAPSQPQQQPLSFTEEQMMHADWDRVDVVEEGTREQMRQQAAQKPHVAHDDPTEEEAKQQSEPSPRNQPAPRPASAHPTFSATTAPAAIVGAAAQPAPLVPTPPFGLRPTSAFPRPPSTHHTAAARGGRAARAQERPQSALMPSVAP